MEYGNIAQWVGLLISTLTLIWAVASFRGKAAEGRVASLEKAIADKASVGRMGALEDRVDKVEDRTTQMEGELRHLPSREQTHGMELAMRDMAKEIGVLTERLKPIQHTTERLQEWMREDAKEKRQGAS
ncbi:MAG: hypothetical protein B7Y12_02110 [Rhizobiales bacterium 24-66-13]|nr:MAG: hypothetical protein B7Y61_01140 [Rhizobiales bacterium 35-66-30]OYZ82809.1 MAG: hypothetical protein B7Y12_02110 [Rhizobiales bacterium 24-66-13]OZB11842.1 MAG: hypothetical protein B7X67_02090 [Rhizobiales bacterium 39-66-18]HQS08733.1 DUF2730 family protein [Xanthobacteraceae bacterium]HQS45934.1 DUF2730 family protein [Xanthobacteraceae bacterium]